MQSTVLQKSPQHHRARLAKATRDGNAETAAEADIALRAHRVAKAIKLACAGPPLPPEVIDQLRNLLPPTPAGR